MKAIFGTSQIGLVLDAFVSEDQGLMYIKIQVPTASLAVDTAWVRVSRGVTQLARQKGEFEPEVEGMDVYFCEGRHSSRSSPARKHPRLGIGRPIAAHFTNHTATTARSIALRPAGFRQAVHRRTDCSPAASERERPIWIHLTSLSEKCGGMWWFTTKESRTSKR